MDLSSFDRIPREELIARARALGVERPELMTRVELTDQIVQRTETDPAAQKRARGWFGVARDLVASVVESGLNLPDAAAVIRGERTDPELKGPAPVATVTLAEIYATQGHVDRALAMLDEVLTSEPDHPAALGLRARLAGEPDGHPEREVEPEPQLDVEPERQLDTALEPEAEREPEQAEQFARPDASVEPEPVLEAQTTHEVAAAPAPEPRREPEPVAAPAASVEPGPAHVLPTASAPSVLVLVLRTRGAHPVVCWSLPPEHPASATRWELRCFGFKPAAGSVERREETVPLSTPRGSHELASFDARTVVRVALGVQSEREFAPVAIASELAVQNGDVEVRFRPPLAAGAPEGALPSPLERALAREFAP